MGNQDGTEQARAARVIDNTIAGATSSTAAVVTTGIWLIWYSQWNYASAETRSGDIKHTTDRMSAVRILGSSSTGKRR